MLGNDIAQNLESRDQVALCDLLGRVQSVLWEKVEDIDAVEEHGHGPVGDVRGNERQPEVGYEGKKVGHGPQLVSRERREVGRGSHVRHDGRRVVGRVCDRAIRDRVDATSQVAAAVFVSFVCLSQRESEKQNRRRECSSHKCTAAPDVEREFVYDYK